MKELFARTKPVPRVDGEEARVFVFETTTGLMIGGSRPSDNHDGCIVRQIHFSKEACVVLLDILTEWALSAVKEKP